MSQLSDYLDDLIADLHSSRLVAEQKLGEAVASMRAQLDAGSCEVVVTPEQARLLLAACQPLEEQE